MCLGDSGCSCSSYHEPVDFHCQERSTEVLTASGLAPAELHSPGCLGNSGVGKEDWLIFVMCFGDLLQEQVTLVEEPWALLSLHTLLGLV